MPALAPRYRFSELIHQGRPCAVAWMNGSADYPSLSGLVRFYQVPFGGLLIEAEFYDLPVLSADHPNRFYGLHIHEHGVCSGDLSDAGGHYNPYDQPHPYHAGDLLPVLGNDGYAWSAFYDGQLSVSEILERSVILHLMPDDFTTQPAGNSGARIACGVIRLTGSA